MFATIAGWLTQSWMVWLSVGVLVLVGSIQQGPSGRNTNADANVAVAQNKQGGSF